MVSACTYIFGGKPNDSGEKLKSGVYRVDNGFVWLKPLGGCALRELVLFVFLCAVLTQANAVGILTHTTSDTLMPLRKGLQTMSTTNASVVPVDLPPGFTPVRYRPLPKKIEGLQTLKISLNGAWRINPTPGDGVRDLPLTSPEWGDITIPGQWKQQGYDVPRDAVAAMAREFAIPKEWQGYRTYLRFDSIHAGTTYWLNGRKLGYSENLFTPVEWDITEAVKVGETNRLDLSMKVDTVSEQLSSSSNYAFHTLGGIDRAVYIYALPPVNIKHLNLTGDLDSHYKDGLIHLEIEAENLTGQPVEEVTARLKLYGPVGQETAQSLTSIDFGTLNPGTTTRSATSTITEPLQWSAEKPKLYRLVIEFYRHNRIIETIERNIGFRKVEIKDRQVYINGRKVKFAGACRHEIDPLTGRADTMHHAEEDMRLTKAGNLNYIRTSHYPPPEELVDAADRLGVYLEVEAPFCWVGATDDMSSTTAILTPTSAMVDLFASHPSVIIWSMANESHFNDYFIRSNEMVKALDPSRLTVFDDAFSKKENDRCDILSIHYPGMPYDAVAPSDPRPLFLGEYFFPICHEQTDVWIDPGLREAWGHGHADPSSAWAKQCNEQFDKPGAHPGAKSGFWDHIVASEQLIGGAIWALLDEPFYFKDGTHAGYAWVHGFWGLLDAWRRPKPEYELSKHIFSPVWFPKRTATFTTGQKAVTIPVENRYSFTDLNELQFEWMLGEHKGVLTADGAPGTVSNITLPVPEGASEGDAILLRIMKDGALVDDLMIHLGQAKTRPVPQPSAGAPAWREEGDSIIVEGNGFTLVLDRKNGDLQPSDSRFSSPVRSFPSLHLTRYDFGDFIPDAPRYGVLPDTATRQVESVSVHDTGNALAITIKDRYEYFAGQTTWVIDRAGVGKVTTDYTYSGDELNAREIGIRFLVDRACDTLSWQRWSEWDTFPTDSICRTEGTATVWRAGTEGADQEGVEPDWPWGQDQTELGTADFRGIKFCIYQASLTAKSGYGVAVNADADRHTRCCLTKGGILMHVLTDCHIAQVIIKDEERVGGEYTVNLRR